MGQGEKTIRLEAYNPGWDGEFVKIRQMIESYIGDLIVGIEHVGSTAVPGLVAKPIIDLDVIIADPAQLPLIISLLGEAGFEHEGDLGIHGREAFRRACDDGMMPYHLYVCVRDGKELTRHIRFRDYLRDHSEARDRYGALKERLAAEHAHDRDAYTRGKDSFIREILAKCD